MDDDYSENGDAVPCDACKGAGQFGDGIDEECTVCYGSGVQP